MSQTKLILLTRNQVLSQCGFISPDQMFCSSIVCNVWIQCDPGGLWWAEIRAVPLWSTRVITRDWRVFWWRQTSDGTHHRSSAHARDTRKVDLFISTDHATLIGAAGSEQALSGQPSREVRISSTSTLFRVCVSVTHVLKQEPSSVTEFNCR